MPKFFFSDGTVSLIEDFTTAELYGYYPNGYHISDYMNGSDFSSTTYEGRYFSDTSTCDIGYSSWSFCARIKITSWTEAGGVGQYNILCSKYPSSVGTQIGYHIVIYETGWLLSMGSVPGSDLIEFSNTHGLSLNTWYHVAFICNRTTGNVSYYLNGVYVNNSSVGMGSTGYDMSISERFKVGYGYIGENLKYFNGWIDNVWLFDGHPLTSGDVQQIYNVSK